MWHAVLPRYSCCAEVEKGQLICCEVAVSLGKGENLGSGGRPAPKIWGVEADQHRNVLLVFRAVG